MNLSLDVGNCPEGVTTLENYVDSAAEDFICNIKCHKKSFSLQMPALTWDNHVYTL
jgi:hypothetical protein